MLDETRENIVNGRICSRSIYLDDNRNLVIMLRIQEQMFSTPYSIVFTSGKDAIPMEMLRRLLEVVGVNSFDSLFGQYVRVQTNGKTGAAGKILAIGNILADEWFSFDAFPKKEW